MRYWEDDSRNRLSSKSSSQKMSEAEQPTMASQTLIIAPAGPDPTTKKQIEKPKDLSTSAASDPSTLPAPEPFSEAATKKLLRKLDRNMIPFFAILYLLCYLDRTNIGNARLVGLEKDLGMQGRDYNIALSIFFPFCVAAQIPSNIMMKRIRPSIWLTCLTVSWGVVMICMGFVHNLSGLLICRIFLGLTEGGLFPGVNYCITMWYRRHECAFRMALFFSAATAAGAFGGLFARGISDMDGTLDKSGWSWIFILEGVLTLSIGSFSYWVINDSPATANFLTPAEYTEVQRRLFEDRSGLTNDFHFKFVIQAFTDWKIYVNMSISIGLFTSLYSISLFLPTIIKQLGYSANQAQLMTVPVYFVACACTITGSYFSDRLGQRGPFLLGFELCAVTGFVMLISSDNPHVQYAGTFFAASGIFPCIPLMGSWNSNNIGGTLKRGVGIAMQVGFGNLGGVISGFVYLSTDQPRQGNPAFLTGHAVLIGLISMSFILTVFMTTYYRRENQRRDNLCSSRNISIENYTDEMKWQEREKSDDATFWRYTA